MDITYLGHSAFRIRGKEVTIVTDPYPPESGSSMGKVSAQIVTVSQDEEHHAFAEGVAGEPRVVRGPGEYEIADILIAGIPTSVQPGKGPINTAYVFRVEDMSVCHLGNTTTKLSDEQVEEIGDIDVLMVPVGGGHALGAVEAHQVVAQLEPSVVIPMHFRTDGLTDTDLDTVDGFCREIGLKEVMPESKLSVSRSSLSHEVKVVVLEKRRV